MKTPRLDFLGWNEMVNAVPNLLQRGYFGLHWQDDFDALIAAGADFYALNDVGETPLSSAKEQNESNPKILRSLQSFAAKRNVKE